MAFYTFFCILSVLSLLCALPTPEIDRTVTINGEVFSMDAAPSADSALVQNEIERLLGPLNLEDLVTDLGRVGNFTRLAYNGVAGHTELQIEVQRLGYDITKLADKSAITIHKFGTTATSIIESLEATYGFLLEGLEEFSLEMLASCADLARQMAEAAEELHLEFEAQAEKTIETLENTQRAKGMQENKVKTLQEEQAELEIKREQERILKEEAEKAAQRYESYYKEAERRELKALRKAGNFFLKLGEALIPGLDLTSGYKKSAESAKSDKLEYLKMMQAQYQAKLEANQKLIEFARTLETMSAEEMDTETAIKALFQAIGGLKNLSAIMKQAALFWYQLMVHCQTLSTDRLQNLVEKASDKPLPIRMKLYTTSVFKKKAIRYYAKWVGLAAVSDKYMKQIKETQKDLYSYIRENYTIEQSRVVVKELAKAFQEELEKAQADLQERDSDLSNEINDLKNAPAQDVVDDAEATEAPVAILP